MAADRWQRWRFLLGQWTGEGGGAPGRADAGGCSFAIELNGNVLVRRNWLQVRATSDHPAMRHEDVLYVYPHGEGWRAMYFDSEGHVHSYRGVADGRSATLESDPDMEGTRFRITYGSVAEKRTIRFDICPRGGEFAEHVSGTLEPVR